ncbi:hypothetical protein LI201_10830, partial [Acidaminococcus intestini]|uniref:hypothetical protein n=1 Tax=Acidaminococcus intestini TaxID=187327 RepID=UPI001D096A49
YRDSTDVLEEMKIDYPKDYKVQMWICYNYLDEASEEGTYSNVSGDLKFTIILAEIYMRTEQIDRKKILIWKCWKRQ